jgi:hypothetical protein
MSSEENKVPVSYIERAVAQAEVVDKLAKEVEEAPGEMNSRQLEIETEKLAYYQNAAKGNPKLRAKIAVEIARSCVLGRAVTQPLPPLN